MRRFIWTEFVFPSTLQLAPLLTSIMEPVQKFSSIELIQLGLQEALVNAVIHGNACDPQKTIRIRRILTPNWCIWQIQDQGNGIEKSSRISTLPEEVEAESGRGLFLINECFDDVRWSRKGNRLQVASIRK